MRTVRCNDRLGGPPCGQNERRLWKHNLSATTVADGKYAQIDTNREQYYFSSAYNWDQRPQNILSLGRISYLVILFGNSVIWDHSQNYVIANNEKVLQKQR